jgi:hypothetical protein
MEPNLARRVIHSSALDIISAEQMMGLYEKAAQSHPNAYDWDKLKGPMQDFIDSKNEQLKRPDQIRATIVIAGQSQSVKNWLGDDLKKIPDDVIVYMANELGKARLDPRAIKSLEQSRKSLSMPAFIEAMKPESITTMRAQVDLFKAQLPRSAPAAAPR